MLSNQKERKEKSRKRPKWRCLHPDPRRRDKVRRTFANPSGRGVTDARGCGYTTGFVVLLGFGHTGDRNRLCLSLTRRTRLDRRNSRFHRTSEREQRFRVARRSAFAARSDQETTGIEDMIRRPKGRTGGLAASSPGGASEGDPEMAVPGSAKSLDWRSRILLRCLRVGTAPNDIQSQ